MSRFFIIPVYTVLFSLLISVCYCFANGYQEVGLKTKSVPTDWNITLTWSVPKTMKANSVLLVRKEKGYPQSTKDGSVVYTGYGGKAEDNNLVADTEYFYRFFLLNSKGEITGWARHKEKT